MTLSTVLFPFLKNIIWIFPLIILVIALKSPWGKGKTGELIVRIITKYSLNKNDYYHFHDLILPTLDGTTQIDHLFISKYGIFVVETKNMRGWIFGKENDKFWTQKIYKRSFKFQNPIHQNFKHIKAVESIVAVPLNCIHSVIVFVGDNKFKTKIPQNVTYGLEAVSYIKSFKDVVFSEKQVSEIVIKLGSGKIKNTFNARKKHIQQLETRKNNSEQKCPRCGNFLIQRENTLGKPFLGCSSFPNCRFTQNIT